VDGLPYRVKKVTERTLIFFDKGLNKMITSSHSSHLAKLK